MHDYSLRRVEYGHDPVKIQKQAYIYAAAAVFFWSTVALAFKLSLRYLGVLQILFWSTAVSVIVLFLILLAQRKLHLLKAFTGRDCMASLLLGLLNPFLYYLVLFKAYALLPAQEAQPLNYTWTITLVILSVPLLKQKVHGRDIAGIVTSYAGAFVIASRGDVTSLHFSNPEGVALALGSSVIWAVFWIFNIRDRRDEVARLFLNFVFGLVFITAAILLTSTTIEPEKVGILGAAYIGLFEMGLTFVLWLKALKLSRSTAQVSNLIYISPFLSLLLIHYVVGEAILPSTMIGLIFIVSGILIQHSRRAVRSLPGQPG